MLIILNDPAGITGRRRIPWGRGTVLEQIAQAMPEGGGDCEVRYNGETIDPVRDRRMESAPQPGDEVVVVHRPEGVETWILVASVLLAAYSYTLIPKPTDQPTQSTSPNNQLTSQTNIARAYQAIPDVYGYRRVWPDLIQPSTVEYVSNVKLVTEWLCVSRGTGTITDVRYAETPIDSISGAQWDAYYPSATPNTYPEDNQTTLPDVYEAFPSPDVNGQELSDAPGSLFEQGAPDTTAGSPDFTIRFYSNLGNFEGLKSVAGSGSAQVSFDFPEEGFSPFNEFCPVVSFFDGGSYLDFTFTAPAAMTITSGGPYAERPVSVTVPGAGAARGPYTLPVDSDQIWANFAFLRGLVGSVEIEASWVAVTSSGVPITGTEGSESRTFTESSYDQRFYTWKITPAGGLRRYRISFSRITPDLGNGADVCKLEEVYAVRYYPTLLLPGVTVVKVTTRATSQAIGFQDRKFNLRWLRHVRTLTSTTLSGSRNFARALVHLWAISGNDVAELDTTAMQAINTALGEDGPLARFDWSFDDAAMSLGERLQIIANAARCVIWRDGTLWTLTRDQARTVPELQLDYRNLAAGGDSSLSYSAHLPASEDGVELEFIEETEQSRKDYIRLDISSGSIAIGTSANPKKVKLLGCATQAQAVNRARLEARKLLFQRTSVQDTALADAASLGPGSLVRWIDPHDFYADDGLQAGEVLAIDGSTITTSEPLQWGGETTGRMLFTGVDGASLGAAVVVTPAGHSLATLSSVPAGLYVRDDTRQLGSRFAFGAGLSAAEIAAAGLYTVTEIRPASDRTVAVSMVNYDARIYADDTVAAIGQAAEVDSALPVSPTVRVLGIASETDTARSVGTPAPQSAVLGQASESDSALAATIGLGTWNPSDKDSDITLSGGNLTASGPGETGSVRATQARSASGSWYFEITIGGTDSNILVGIAKSTADITSFAGADADGWGYYRLNGQKFNGSGGSSYGASYGSGDVIAFWLDGGTLTAYKNGTSQGTMATGLTGNWYPIFGSAATGGGVTGTGTLNVGATAFSGSLPSGASAWG